MNSDIPDYTLSTPRVPSGSEGTGLETDVLNGQKLQGHSACQCERKALATCEHC